jgi:hypothetical protein
MALACWLVFGPPAAAPDPRPKPARQPVAATVPMRKVWPRAKVFDAPGVLADGAPFNPWLYLDAQTAIGVAPTPDGVAKRVLLRGAGGDVRELHRVRQDQYPQFFAFTRSGDGADVYWAESTTPTPSTYVTQVWRASVVSGTPAVALTADTGEPDFANSQFDLLVEQNRLYWAATAPGDAVATEVRSVSVDGGSVTTQRVDGAYQLAAWPWLQSVSGLGDWPVELRNLRTGQRIVVSTASTERVRCSPAWCRSMVIGGSDGSTLYDVMRPDGSGRRRVGDSTLSAVTADVALLDRYEPIYQDVPANGTVSRRLLIYDITTDRLVAVADDVSTAVTRQQLLWWSTIGQGVTTWHSLDLAALAA